MAHLDIPGAKLYHEVVGEGPTLLCISGADGSCEIWRGFAACLKNRFKVVLWDRRGFSRSTLTDNQDYSQRLETDADDAARLLEKYSPNEPATVIGNSSGAIVAMRLLTRHSDKIRTLIPYEPPTSKLLSDFETLWATHEDIYATWRAAGPYPALEKFTTLTHTNPGMIRMLMDFSKPYLWSNLQYWFEREFMTYPKAEFDLRELAQLKEKLLIINGEDSPKQAYQYRGNLVLAEWLGLELMLLPGEHVGHATHAEAFSTALVEKLKAKDQFYAKL